MRRPHFKDSVVHWIVVLLRVQDLYKQSRDIHLHLRILVLIARQILGGNLNLGGRFTQGLVGLATVPIRLSI